MSFRIGKTLSSKIDKNVHRSYAHFTYPIMAILLFWIGMFWMSESFELPWLLSYLLLINALSFFFIAIDKVIAMVRDERVPEWVLHTLALLGGIPATALAIHLFHHNRDKVSFRIVLWVIAGVQVVIILFWHEWILRFW